ncbi:acyl transferase/acyl hydrolase/lysophospholipase [Peziza echinospora]|nr:acyl transferase/acyl hydrolase/lysophospholipase [Peziza echinospora]
MASNTNSSRSRHAHAESNPARPNKPAQYTQEAGQSSANTSSSSSAPRRVHGSSGSHSSPQYNIFPSPQIAQPPPPLPPKVSGSARSSDNSVSSVQRPYAHKVRDSDSMNIVAELEGDMFGLGLSNVEKPKVETSKKPRRIRRADGMAEELVRQSREPPGRRKVRVLCLDGGGIRGYSSLVILSDLMHRVHVLINRDVPVTQHSLPRPCDFFDIIGGNGTGGLIALMLGRMRMDVETCKEYYEALTRYVFVTDKTILGMPYGNTLFKASRLEEAIKVCVRECTRFDHLPLQPYTPYRPGETSSPPPLQPASSIRSHASRKNSWGRSDRHGSLKQEQVEPTSTFSSFSSGSTVHDQSRFSKGSDYSRGRSSGSDSLGSAEALLYDHRVGACKTLVTSTYMSSPRGAPPVLIRSYRTTRESTAVSEKATIWQAGRATCASKAAFKPVTIANVTFQDEGYGKYNPASFLLDEALARETWHDVEHVVGDDGRPPEIGLFVSIGTGKRFTVLNDDGAPHKPGGLRKEKQLWWETMGMLEQYSEAKKRLLEKLEDCETVHLNLLGEELEMKGVDKNNYFRFNVEVGVGEFGMNEWNRLAEVSTGTRRYLARNDVENNVASCAEKLVNIWAENERRDKWLPELETSSASDKEAVGPEAVIRLEEEEARRRREREKAKKRARAASSPKKDSRISPPQSPQSAQPHSATAELEADIDRAASEWSSKSSFNSASSDGEYTTRPPYQQQPPPPNQVLRQKYPYAAPPPQIQQQQQQPAPPQAYFPSQPPERPYHPHPNVSNWVQQLPSREPPIPIPSPGDFLPPKIITSPPPPGDEYFPPPESEAFGPEIRVTSPTTVAGDETPPGTPLELKRVRSIEGDRIARRERRERKARKEREAAAAAAASSRGA